MLYFNEPSLASANKSYFYLQPTDWNNSYYLLQTISSGTQLMKNLSNDNSLLNKQDDFDKLSC